MTLISFCEHENANLVRDRSLLSTQPLLDANSFLTDFRIMDGKHTPRTSLCNLIGHIHLITSVCGSLTGRPFVRVTLGNLKRVDFV